MKHFWIKILLAIILIPLIFYVSSYLANGFPFFNTISSSLYLVILILSVPLAIIDGSYTDLFFNTSNCDFCLTDIEDPTLLGWLVLVLIWIPIAFAVRRLIAGFTQKTHTKRIFVKLMVGIPILLLVLFVVLVILLLGDVYLGSN